MEKCACCDQCKKVKKCDACTSSFKFCDTCLEEEMHTGIFTCKGCHKEICKTYQGDFKDYPDCCFSCGFSKSVQTHLK